MPVSRPSIASQHFRTECIFLKFLIISVANVAECRHWRLIFLADSRHKISRWRQIRRLYIIKSFNRRRCPLDWNHSDIVDISDCIRFYLQRLLPWLVIIQLHRKSMYPRQNRMLCLSTTQLHAVNRYHRAAWVRRILYQASLLQLTGV